METKLQRIEDLRRKGFTEDFVTLSPNQILLDQKRIYKAFEMKVAAYYTGEETEDPKENFIVYAIETVDGKKGILMEEHCTQASEKVEKFIHTIQLARNNNKKSWFRQPISNLFKISFSSNL